MVCVAVMDSPALSRYTTGRKPPCRSALRHAEEVSTTRQYKTFQCLGHVPSVCTSLLYESSHLREFPSRGAFAGLRVPSHCQPFLSPARAPMSFRLSVIPLATLDSFCVCSEIYKFFLLTQYDFLFTILLSR